MRLRPEDGTIPAGQPSPDLPPAAVQTTEEDPDFGDLFNELGLGQGPDTEVDDSVDSTKKSLGVFYCSLSQ